MIIIPIIIIAPFLAISVLSFIKSAFFLPREVTIGRRIYYSLSFALMSIAFIFSIIVLIIRG